MFRWKPQPGPQTLFCYSPAHEVFYGGAAGGGKSDALLSEAQRFVRYPGYHALILRRTYPELIGKGSGLVPRSEEFFTGRAEFDRARLIWTFPSGATIGFGNLERPSSVFAYHSSQFAFIAFDELTTFLEAQFLYMLSRLRSPAGIPARVRTTGNPGGIGHEWVRRRYIEKLRPFEVRWFRRATADGERQMADCQARMANGEWPMADVEARMGDGERRMANGEPTANSGQTTAEEVQPPTASSHTPSAISHTPSDDVETTPDDPDALSRQFIPATVFDNQILLRRDPGYVRRLKALDPVERRRLLDGDWWVANAGAVYSTFTSANVCADEPTRGLPIELAFDDGYHDPRAILLLQRRGDQILVFDELYHSRHLAEECVAEVIARCQTEGWPLPELAVGSPEAGQLHAYFRRANIAVRSMATPIIEGIAAVRRLIVDGRQFRALRVNRRCANLLRELQGGYQYASADSARRGETPLDRENHCADALRYWVWMRYGRKG